MLNIPTVDTHKVIYPMYQETAVIRDRPVFPQTGPRTTTSEGKNRAFLVLFSNKSDVRNNLQERNSPSVRQPE